MSAIDPVNRPTGRSVLLFSGGLDTVASAWLLRPDVLLFLPHGQRYVAMETAAVASLVRDHLLPPTCEVITCDALRLSAFERPDAIIPSRNLLFVTAAAWFGERVFLGAMAGDRTLDKSPGFFARATELLSYLYGPQYWCEGRTVEVRAVFEGLLTKTALVRRYLAAGYPVDALYASRSCYDLPAGSAAAGCGQCKPCFRKWVAFVNNGVAIPEGYFLNAPWRSPWLPAVWSQVIAGTYRTAEDPDWIAAIDRIGYAITETSHA